MGALLLAGCDGGDAGSESSGQPGTDGGTSTTGGETGESEGSGSSSEGTEESGEEGSTTDDSGGEWPDALPIDCLDDANAEELACLPLIQLDPGSIGEGPHFGIGMVPGVLGGFLDRDGERIVLGARFGVDVAPGGMVATVDLRTGERTFVSGHYDDPATGPTEVGSGAPIDFVYDVAPTAAGWVAIGQIGTSDVVIVEVDPSTGTRTAVTPAEGSGCMDPEGTPVVLDPYAVDVTDDGEILTTFRGAAGIGVVGYSGGACRVVSRMGGDGAPVGGGPEQTGGYFVDIEVDGDTLWALEWQTQSVFSIDIATGQRMRVSSSSNTTTVGEGAPVRVQSLALTRGGIATYDDEGVTLVDPATGMRTEIPKDGPLAIAGDGHVLAHPNDAWLVVLSDVGVAVLDTTTGNSNVLSF
jgi:hypothetical protein